MQAKFVFVLSAAIILMCESAQAQPKESSYNAVRFSWKSTVWWNDGAKQIYDIGGAESKRDVYFGNPIDFYFEDDWIIVGYEADFGEAGEVDGLEKNGFLTISSGAKLQLKRRKTPDNQDQLFDFVSFNYRLLKDPEEDIKVTVATTKKGGTPVKTVVTLDRAKLSFNDPPQGFNESKFKDLVLVELEVNTSKVVHIDDLVVRKK